MRVRLATPAGAVLLSCLLLVLAGCAGPPGRGSRDGTTCTGELTGPGPVYLTAWFHTGTPAEARAMRQQVAAFNARLARANGEIPATRAAISRAPAFSPGGPEHLYVQQLEDGIARPRPQTPAYPAITAAFSAAFLNIAQGGDVRRAPDIAVGQIDGNLAAHRCYQPPEP